MRHIKVAIGVDAGEQRDMILALLSEMGYEGFEEAEDSLNAYIPEATYAEAELKEILMPFGLGYTLEVIEPQNWNEVWESSFEPVVVTGFCTVRAHFHNVEVNTPYCVVVTPKMSFGTGHHATTQLMIMAMQHMPLVGKAVLDFGTGTGVLAILAGMLGAGSVMAIDNDEWAVTNALENVDRNDVTQVHIALGEVVPEQKYDVILANINRHILLHHMTALYDRLTHNGILLMSGLLDADEQVIIAAATEAGFSDGIVKRLNGWISVQMLKS